MRLSSSKEGFKLEGAYSLDNLLKIKSELSHYGFEGNVRVDLSELKSINAPILSLLLEMRRHTDSIVLYGGSEDFYDMLRLYGLEAIFEIE
ncbi:STAS domain-containing protein [Rhodanobacter aciditrophus]|uniref:STAS domain-containing protein n=1 Tax=Rhodanobacter aciditrophus TaxID=1623218 RepID=A0ABW4B141_9GAMM